MATIKGRFACGAAFCACVAFAAVAGPLACFVDIDQGLLDAGDGGARADVAYTGVPCSDASCIAPSSVCCSVKLGDFDYLHGACYSRDNCPTGDYLSCTSENDCTYPGALGPLCCVVRDDAGVFTQSQCLPTCAGGDSFCTGPGDPCPQGLACSASPDVPRLFECLTP